MKNIYSWLNKSYKLLHKHKDVINILLTFSLFITTVVLIVYTCKSINISMNIGEIELSLAVEREKQNTLNKINLAEDLLHEVQWNKKIFELYNEKLELSKSTNKFRMDNIQNVKIQHAIDMVGFGSESMRKLFQKYLLNLNLVKKCLKDIENYGEANSDIKIERTDHILKVAQNILHGKQDDINMNDFIDDIEMYTEEQKNNYKELDKSHTEKLKLLIK